MARPFRRDLVDGTTGAQGARKARKGAQVLRENHQSLDNNGGGGGAPGAHRPTAGVGRALPEFPLAIALVNCASSTARRASSFLIVSSCCWARRSCSSAWRACCSALRCSFCSSFSSMAGSLKYWTDSTWPSFPLTTRSGYTSATSSAIRPYSRGFDLSESAFL